jgi:hypothetical protein
MQPSKDREGVTLSSYLAIGDHRYLFNRHHWASKISDIWDNQTG